MYSARGASFQLLQPEGAPHYLRIEKRKNNYVKDVSPKVGQLRVASNFILEWLIQHKL